VTVASERIAERVVTFRPRTVLTVIGVVLAVALALEILWIARTVVTWIVVALFLTLAINPAVEWLRRRWHMGRGKAVAVIYVSVLLAVGAFAALFIPTLVNQVDDFIQAVPGYVHDLTHGRGPLGFLETRYHVVERVRTAIENSGGASKLFSGAGVILSIGQSIVAGIAAIVTIIFMVLFMLLEGPTWVERFYGVLSDDVRPRWRRIGHEIYRTVGGYVTGNLLILGVPYPVALGFIAAILDLLPLAGATIAGLIVVGAAFIVSTSSAIIMAVVVVVYQQAENHILQPIVYGRTVNLSPLAVLIAVLLGAEVAGVLGALGAIPIAGTLQVVLVDELRHRRERRARRLAARPPLQPPPPRDPASIT
jgi:predicted PurR-regulated permease PerM